MLTYIELGSAPYDDNCVYVRNEPYLKEMMEECKRYKEYLYKLFREQMPGGCRFGIKRFQHDFGNYFEVVIWYDDEIEEQVEFAYMVEGNLPEKWEG